jgi:hypothetical protein
MANLSVKTGVISRRMLVGNAPFIPTDFESIATATGTGSSDTITFTSIPSTYKHLQIRAFCGKVGSAGLASLEFNNDSSSIYATHRLIGDGVTPVVAQGQTGRANTFYSIYTGGNTASALSGSIIDIHDYSSTTKNKIVRSFTGLDTNGNGTDSASLYLTSALWPSTSAITSIEIISGGGLSWSTSSVFSLYGIKG